MKKVIEFSLKPEGEFFLELKNKFLDHGEFGIGYDVTPVVNQIVSATIKTLNEEVKDQKPNYKGCVKFTFEKEEDTCLHFHDILEENIARTLGRVHPITVERFCDLIEQFMVDTADKQAEEKRVKVNPLVDPDKELQAITNYVSLTWDGFDKVNAPDFFNKIWTEVTELTKNKFSQDGFTNLALQLKEDFPAGSKEMNGKIPCSEISTGIFIGTSILSSMVKEGWDYEKNVNRILFDIKKEFPDASSLRPKGWYKMSKDYKDFDGMPGDQETKKEFKGMNSESAGAYSFDVRVSLPHAMYDTKCQGRKPLEVLVGAMLGHAYVMNEHNNNSKMLKEWVEFSKQIKVSNIQYEFKEPLNQALKSIIDLQDFSSDNPKVLEILGLEPSVKKKLKF